MSLKEVREEILNKAKQEADALLREAEKEANVIKHEAMAKAREYKERIEEMTRKTVETMEKREIAQAEFDVRKAMLEKKKEAIAQVMQEVKNSLENLPEKRRAEYITKLCERAKGEIEISKVCANSKDKLVIQKMKDVEYEQKNILGGIIAQTEDDRISVDYSYETILEEIEEKILPELGKIFFK